MPIIIAALYLFSVLVILEPSFTLKGLTASVIFSLVGAVPHIMILNHIRGLETNHTVLFYITVQIILSLTALYIYYDGYIVNPDPQSGILFVVIPLYQSLIIKFLGIAEKLFSRWR